MPRMVKIYPQAYTNRNDTNLVMLVTNL